MTLQEELQNDPEAGARRLAAEHGPRLHALALRLCPCAADAEELVLRALERAVAGIGRYRPSGPFDAWLRTILLNLWRNDRRAAHPAPPPDAPEPDETPAPGPAPDEEAAARADAEAARRAVAGLPPRLREAVVLRYFEGLDVAAAARALGVPAGTVKFRLFEARRRLRRALGWMRDAPPPRANGGPAR